MQRLAHLGDLVDVDGVDPTGEKPIDEPGVESDERQEGKGDERDDEAPRRKGPPSLKVIK